MNADVNPTDIHRAIVQALDPSKRPVRLDWGRRQSQLQDVLVPQHIDITEGLCTGIDGTVTCLSARPDLPQAALMGRPVSVQLVTDRGKLHPINGIVTNVRMGHSDGGLTCVQLTVRDALTILEQRVNHRVFRAMSLPNTLETLIREWRGRSPTLARSFDFELLIDRAQYPVREQTRQAGESDAAFIRRLCRFAGIFWFIRAGKPDGADSDTPVHTLVFCDNAMLLPQSPAGTVPYHHGAAVKDSDSITLLATARSLVPGGVRRASGDYKTGKMDVAEFDTLIDQGEAGNDLAALLMDRTIDPPHAGDSRDDHARLAKARILAHEHRAECVHGASDVRNLPPGTWLTPSGHPEMDTREPEQRQHIVVNLRHQGTNNFPKALGERAQALFAASRWTFDALPASEDGQSRYENTFICVRRGVPLTPAFDPSVDFPPVEPFSAWVVAGKDEAVHCDAYGRIKVQIPGLHPDDHAHAQGAGTSGTERDSAWVRCLTPWAGPNYGVDMLPRAGMEVLIGHLGGDPDKMIILGTVHGGPNMPATFSGMGSLPGNKHISGIKTQEIKGQGHNQLRLDDTSGQISSQLASTHAHSQINLGYLTHPREEGRGTPRGEGLEARSDAHVTLRSGMAMLLSAWQRLKASGGQLAREDYVQLMQDSLDLFKSLGDYAAQHQGVPMDTQAQEALASTIKGWPDQPGEAKGDPAAQAAIGITAPAGISLATPKAVATYAGANVDTVAQKHVQVTSGERINMQAGGGLSFFAHQDGISAIANQGKLRLQSQADDTLIDSAKNIHWTAVDGKLVGIAKEVLLMTPEGAYLKLAGGTVEVGGNGPFISKNSGHQWEGPASMGADLPKFDHGALGRVPKLVRASDKNPVTNYQGEASQATGGASPGQTNATGELVPVKSGRLEQLVVNFFKKRN
ncbi:type VI secretion system Vgr family protein [Ralstonia solanacearum]|uniref:Type IV secretion protein Rhs n=1 Tax=Ralstonia solanacearum TaxID=305 RepID=A0AAD0SC98_RALSL|nr:type VI secretion system tip protein VgrG [Ralstonia solanacearum]AXV84402.1 type IV secretion protein Rhs [Ralstonia solanacearum]AXW55534.1 type IV secretion protein Rhs [Ralstonia solanacearum]